MSAATVMDAARPTRLELISTACPAEAAEQATTSQADVTVAATLLAVVAILGMIAVLGALASSMLTVVVCSLAVVVLSVVTAFRLLRSAGI